MASKIAVRAVERSSQKVSVLLEFDGQEREIYFTASDEFGQHADFLLPLLLLPAMGTGSRLRLPGNLSPNLLASNSKVQDILRMWKQDEYHKIPVLAGSREVVGDPSLGVACFFSGGVDSFYSALKHQDDITHLIFVHGFDLRLHDYSLRNEVAHRMKEAADALGKPLIMVETDLRHFSDPLVSWEMYHGGALACISLLFQNLFKKVIVPATHTYAHLLPWGSHPILDPLWSTEFLELDHDGCEVTRAEKVAYVARNDAAMSHLRVCFVNHGGAYNCGRCEKCIRTMVNLRASGNLKRCQTLPKELDLDAVARLTLIDANVIAFVEENLSALIQRGDDPELSKALSDVLRRDAGDQLSATQKQLGAMRAKFLQARNLNSKLKIQNAQLRSRINELQLSRSQLRDRHSRLKRRYSNRRYIIADSMVGGMLKIPILSGFLRRKIGL